MRAVSRFEADLLRILHGFLRRAPLEQLRPLVMNRRDRPPCLGRDAVELAQQTLAVGCVALLARDGGARPERHLRGDRIVEGRLWARTPPADLGLKFSRHTLGFLVWVTAVEPDEEKATWGPPEAELTAADRLLLYFAYNALAGTEAALALARQPAFTRNALCRLGHPADFGPAPVPDFGPWTAGLGACILEALQGKLAQRWLEAERHRRRLQKWQSVRAEGQALERLLSAFLQAADAAGRPDLARFVLRAAWELLPEGIDGRRWVGRLSEEGPRLADRAETYRAALALPHQLLRLREWTGRARGVGYFDEGYAASQLWKADWERWQGDLLCRRAEAVIQQLDPLRQS